jgi:hypothetical protein
LHEEAVAHALHPAVHSGAQGLGAYSFTASVTIQSG